MNYSIMVAALIVAAAWLVNGRYEVRAEGPSLNFPVIFKMDHWFGVLAECKPVKDLDWVPPANTKDTKTAPPFDPAKPYEAVTVKRHWVCE